MAVKKLSHNIQCLFSTSVHIFSYRRAIEELVYNALDAQSTSIAVRIDIQNNKIQVVDNGCGISKKDFELLGQKYATSKFVDLARYKAAPESYGFRGQSLSTLVDVSKYVKISARMTDTEDTWAKTFYKGKEECTNQTTTRPSKGTTVEVNGFLYNLNIQNKSINPITEINETKAFLEQLSFVHNNVSFSLKDDSKNEIIFKTHKNTDIYRTFQSLFDIKKSDMQELQVEKNDYKIKAYIAKDNDHPDRHHWVFLNKKFVNNTKLHKLIHDNIAKVLNPLRRIINIRKSKNSNHIEDYEPSKNHISFYFIFITCPYYDYDISNTPRQSTLEFKNWNNISNLVKKLVKFTTGAIKVKEIKRANIKVNKEILKDEHERDATRKQVREIMKKILGSNPKKIGITQMQNGAKGKLIKRKKKKGPKLTLSKVASQKHPATKYKELNDDVIVHQIKFDEQSDNIHKQAKTNSKIIYIQQNKSKDETILNDKTKSEAKQLTKVSKKIKIKRKCKKDSFVELFRKRPDLVIERCNLLAEEAEKLIPRDTNYRKQRVFINETINYSHVIKHNKNISIRKRVGEIIIHDYFPLKDDEKKQSTKYNNFRDSEKVYLKTSYDLLKTVIGAKQKSTQSLLPTGELQTFHRKNPKPNKAEIPQSTYQSHHYFSNHIVNHNYERFQNVNDEQQKIFHHHNKKGKFKPFCNSKLSYAIGDTTFPNQCTQKKFNCNLVNRYQKNDKHVKRHLFENIHSFSDNFTSHKIEFTDSKEDLCNKFTNYNKTMNINSLSEIAVDRNFKTQITNSQLLSAVVPSTIGLTYAITKSSDTSKLRHNSELNQRNHDKSRSNFCQTTEVLGEKMTHYQVNDLNVILSSNSIVTNSDKLKNYIDPLNVCETILNSDNELAIVSDKSNSQNQLNDSLFNLSLRDLSRDVRNVDKAGDTQKVVHSGKCTVNQPNSVESNELFENQEISESINIIIDAIDRDNVDHIIRTDSIEANPQEAAIANSEESCRITKDFGIRNRLRFLPKGMSPIFDNHCLTTKTESTLKSGYFTDNVYNKFKDEVQTHTEVYEAHFQNPKDFVSKNFVKVINRFDRNNSSLTFDSESLKDAKVFGQIDHKYIASILKGKSKHSKFLVLFDQHAVHERIRLENNLKDYFSENKWKITKLDDVWLKLSKDEILYLHNYKDKFTQFGLNWTILNDCSITLHGIPAALLGKNSRQVEKVLCAAKNLISEVINMIKSQKGSVSLYPKSIMDLVFSESCRYAIKFGDSVSHSECVELIQSLSTCKTPFQCAHGRPVMAVIMDIKPETRIYKHNMEKIRLFKNKTR